MIQKNLLKLLFSFGGVGVFIFASWWTYSQVEISKAKPAVPGDLVAIVDKNACDINILFTDNATNEDGFRVLRELNSSAIWDDVAGLGPNSGPQKILYDGDELSTGTYSWKVCAFNQNGESCSSTDGADGIEIDEEACSDSLVGATAVVNATLSPGALLPTSTPVPFCVWQAVVNVYIRTGPGASTYPEITAVETNTSLPVVGQSEDEQFWAVELQQDLIGYVSKAEKFGKVEGDCSVPILPDPQPASGSENSDGGASVTQCNDGLDNDGDRYIDMRDRGCTDPKDTNE